MPTSLLIRGGRVIDPVTDRDEISDVLVRDGRIDKIGSMRSIDDAALFDARGCVVAPGLIDVHVHLREPGSEEKETISTGTAAAAAGGFTTIFCMPNTKPALDTVDVIVDLQQRIDRDALVRVLPIAAITRDRAGRAPVDFGALADAGVVGFSDDGDTTADSGIMRRALEASAETKLPVIVHCEDKSLARGSMHEGTVSRALGLAGLPAVAEEIIIGRDIMLAEATGGWLHVCHVSTGRGAELIRQGKARGARVTAEVMPHHLTMTDEWVAGLRTLVNVDEPPGIDGPRADPNTKVNPPLRTAADTRCLLAALGDGTIDLVATDHAPHANREKSGSSFERAAFGLSGLEFAVPLMMALVRAGHLTQGDLVRLLSYEPARLWNLPGGSLAEGSPADITVFDPADRWLVDPAALATKSANTPLLGMELQGRVKLTVVGGAVRFGSV